MRRLRVATDPPRDEDDEGLPLLLDDEEPPAEDDEPPAGDSDVEPVTIARSLLSC